MKTFKLDKRFKMYNEDFRYGVETTTETEDIKFREWIDFCEKQWGSSYFVKNKRWQYTHKWNYIKLDIECRIFFRNEKDLMWFTLGTSA